MLNFVVHAGFGFLHFELTWLRLANAMYILQILMLHPLNIRTPPHRKWSFGSVASICTTMCRHVVGMRTCFLALEANRHEITMMCAWHKFVYNYASISHVENPMTASRLHGLHFV